METVSEEPLNDVVRRIGQHWPLILVFVLAGVVAGMLVASGPATYTASTRFVLDTQDPKSREESMAIANTAQAIATSPTEVSKALALARISNRNALDVADHHVSVSALGLSGTLQLSVTDQDPKVAAAIANALATRTIQARLSVSNGRAQRLLADLDGQIASLNRKISGGKSGSVDALVQQRDAAQSARNAILAAQASRPAAVVISPAAVPDHPDSSHLLPDALLGAILGLILGVAVAGLRETIRPTVAGGDALARGFDTQLLGDLPGDLDADIPIDDSIGIAMRLRLASQAVGTANVALLGATSHADLGQFPERLEAALTEAEFGPAATSRWVNPGRPEQKRARNRRSNADVDRRALRIRPSDALRIRAFDATSAVREGEERAGLVLLSPSTLTRSDLVKTSRLLEVTQLPLLGLITHAPTRWRERAADRVRLLRFASRGGRTVQGPGAGGTEEHVTVQLARDVEPTQSDVAAKRWQSEAGGKR
jgi:hypothetical protein